MTDDHSVPQGPDPAVPGLPPLDLESVAALRGAVLRLGRRLRYQTLGDGDLSATELAVLGRIGRCGPMAPSALARAEHVKPPSMTKVIESLEERHLVRRDPHPTDRRQCLISRTDKGEAFVLETRRRRTAWLAQQMSELSPDERATLLAAGPVLDLLADRP
ncbi:MarR family winged helix-turn-helix transcriptional regulator [Nakamurella sp.]|uniref:MarR family winged helix-turn-helix transcriptional regulator n=1 Tax=Nakamurella sp. TaxID=1869182 RepID=UPI0037832273